MLWLRERVWRGHLGTRAGTAEPRDRHSRGVCFEGGRIEKKSTKATFLLDFAGDVVFSVGKPGNRLLLLPRGFTEGNSDPCRTLVRRKRDTG